MKKIISIAIVTAMIVTFMSVFAAAATTSVTLEVTPPAVGETVGSVRITAGGSYVTMVNCFDYSSLSNLSDNETYNSYSAFENSTESVSVEQCIENKQYVAVLFIDTPDSAISSVQTTTPESTQCGILLTNSVAGGGYENYIYVVFTPTAAASDSNEDDTTPEDPPSNSGSDSTSSTGTSESAEVKVTYVAAEEPTTIYKVDIVFGSMEFTYTEESKGTWNPSTHQYDDPEESSWSCAQGDNTIEITNHSNAEVNVAFSYEPKTDFSSVTGSFTNSALTLATAEETSLTNAPSASVNLHLDGTIDDPLDVPTVCGTVTVTFH